MVDIRDFPDVVDAINASLNNKGTVEVKLERDGKELVVVEIKRSVKVKQS